MSSLTPFEWRLRSLLLEVARAADPADPEGSCITYRVLGERIDPEGVHAEDRPQTRPRFLGMDKALGAVSEYEDDHGRPLLSALVVVDTANHPEMGAGRLVAHLKWEVDDDQAFWREQLAEVVRYWTSDDETRHLDAALEKVREDVDDLRRMLRRRLPPRPDAD